jgi:septum formation inhibitor MinC
MSRLLDEMAEDSAIESKKSLSTDNAGLKTIAELAEKIQSQEQQIANTEEDLKKQKEELRKLQNEELPMLMQEIGFKKFELEDGSSVNIKEIYAGSISQANKEKAFNWLRENKFDDIIKNTVTTAFGKGEDTAAKNFMDIAEQAGYTPVQKTEVHPQTLKAFIKERVEGGDEFPMELFGAYIGYKAEIKKSKK